MLKKKKSQTELSRRSCYEKVLWWCDELRPADSKTQFQWGTWGLPGGCDLSSSASVLLALWREHRDTLFGSVSRWTLSRLDSDSEAVCSLPEPAAVGQRLSSCPDVTFHINKWKTWMSPSPSVSSSRRRKSVGWLACGEVTTKSQARLPHGKKCVCAAQCLLWMSEPHGRHIEVILQVPARDALSLILHNVSLAVYSRSSWRHTRLILAHVMSASSYGLIQSWMANI